MNNSFNGDTALVKSTDDARQGVTGHGVRYVLMVSIGAAIILLATTLIVFVRE